MDRAVHLLPRTLGNFGEILSARPIHRLPSWIVSDPTFNRGGGGGGGEGRGRRFSAIFATRCSPFSSNEVSGQDVNRDLDAASVREMILRFRRKFTLRYGADVFPLQENPRIDPFTERIIKSYHLLEMNY